MNLSQTPITHFFADGASCMPTVLFAFALCLAILVGNKVLTFITEADLSARDAKTAFGVAQAYNAQPGGKSSSIFPTDTRLLRRPAIQPQRRLKWLSLNKRPFLSLRRA